MALYWNEMHVQQGDIIIVKNTIFKDTGLIDTRIGGHPAIVLDTTDDYLYYLMMRSENGFNRKAVYYQLKETQREKYTRKVEYVNCKYIYKREAGFYNPKDHIKDEQLFEIFEKLVYFQENIMQDPVYPEIADKIKCLSLSKK